MASEKNKKRDNRGQEPKGITNPEYWEKDFENMSWFSKVEKILELPNAEDIAGVILRSVIRTERQRVAIVRLAYRHRKFHDTNHQEMLRYYLASSVGMAGLGRLDQLFAAINLLAPDMYRVAMNMPNRKNDQEKVLRGSDFREERTESKEQ